MAAVVTTARRARSVGFTAADTADASATDDGDDCAAHLDKDLRCPVSLEVMKDPVLLAQSGVSYERGSLEKCLTERPGVDPQTNMRFSGPASIVPNFTLKRLITQLCEDAERTAKRRRLTLSAKSDDDDDGGAVPVITPAAAVVSARAPPRDESAQGDDGEAWPTGDRDAMDECCQYLLVRGDVASRCLAASALEPRGARPPARVREALLTLSRRGPARCDAAAAAAADEIARLADAPLASAVLVTADAPRLLVGALEAWPLGAGESASSSSSARGAKLAACATREAAARGLGAIAHELRHRDAVVHAGAFSPLLRVVCDADADGARAQAARALARLVSKAEGDQSADASPTSATLAHAARCVGLESGRGAGARLVAGLGDASLSAAAKLSVARVFACLVVTRAAGVPSSVVGDSIQPLAALLSFVVAKKKKARGGAAAAAAPPPRWATAARALLDALRRLYSLHSSEEPPLHHMYSDYHDNDGMFYEVCL